MEWIFLEDEMPMDEERVLFVTSFGHITIGTYDEHGYFDDHCDEILSPFAWCYLPLIPEGCSRKCIIATDEACEALLKSVKKDE